MDRINNISKTLKRYSRLNTEQLILLNLLVSEIVDFDKQHEGSLVVDVLLEKIILEIKLKSYQSN